LLDRWSLGTNIAFSRLNYANSLDDNSSGEFWFYRLHQAYPTQPHFNPDGTYANQVRWVENGRASLIEDRTTLSFNTKFDILKDVWTVSADATFKMMNYDRDTWAQATPYESSPGKNSSRNLSTDVSAQRNYERTSVYNLFTNFNKTFADKHFVGAMAGFNQEQFIANSLSVAMTNLITVSIPNLMLAQDGLTRSQGINELSLRGAFGRLNYVYDNKYILEANGRYDGSSRFAKGNRFGFFPSYSAAWVVTQESFLESIKESIRLSNLKLRGSYGTLGNQQLDNNYYPTYANMGQYQTGIIIDGSRPYAMSTPGAATGGLTWETVRTVNGGIDLGFLNSRLTAEFDIYTRYTENMLTQSGALPGVYGTGAPLANAADLKTKGWELTLGWRDAVELGGSPLNYSVRLMIADNRTWITRFDNNPDKRLDNYYEGQELGALWGYTTLGYFNSDEEAAAWADQSALGNAQSNYSFFAGDVKFEDINRDGKINSGNNTLEDHGDRKIIGNNRQRLPYSIDLGVDWKGFDLRLFFQGVGERQAYPTTSHQGQFFWGLYDIEWSNGITKNLDRWTEENPSQDAFFPRIKPWVAQNGELTHTQTKYLQDASYLRLKNLTLGYTIPRQWTQKVKINNLRVFFSGENMFTFHHIQVKGNDPEKFGDGTQIYYPYQRTYSFGLTIGF
jgi:TonB-linked SusC/RagA family outer membrane protein